MRYYITSLILVSFVIFSFKQEQNIGKLLFTQNCSSCHSLNKSDNAPTFKNIRRDYEFKWIVSFLRNRDSLINLRDSKAMYVYYRYNKKPHTRFLSMEERAFKTILDYVDNNSNDTSQYVFRKISEFERKKLITQYEKGIKK